MVASASASAPATGDWLTREEVHMAGEKHRGAPKKQGKKPSAASKAKQAKKLAARTGTTPTEREQAS
jgi:hypothetical protein